MYRPLVSVIIPMHNTESFILNALDSVSMQTYKNLDIIVIDDMSTDSCLALAKSYAMYDSRIKVIPLKKNVGVGGARNVGLKRAKGDFIAWLDSDDIYNIYFIETLVDIALKYDCDIVECQPSDFENATEIDNRRKPNVPDVNDIVFGDGDEVIRRFGTKELQTSLWSKLFKAKVFNSFQFPLGEIYEEPYFYFSRYSSFHKVAFIKEKLYFYRNAQGSIMKQFSDKTIYSNLKLQNFILEQIRHHCPYNTIVLYRVLTSLIVTLQRANYLNKKKETIQLINNQIDKSLILSNGIIKFSLKNRTILYFRRKALFWNILKFVKGLK